MPAVVGIDPSLTKTGVAKANGDVLVVKPTDGMVGAERLVWLRTRTLRLCDTADLVTIEGFSFGSQDKYARESASWGWILRVALWEEGVPFLDVPPLSLKKFATGKGTADKTAMVVAARERLGYTGTSADEADALWLRAMGSAWLGHRVVTLPAVHLSALDKLPAAATVRPDTGQVPA